MTDRLGRPRVAREGSAPRYRLEAAVDDAVSDDLDQVVELQEHHGRPTGPPRHGRGPTTTAACSSRPEPSLAKDEASPTRRKAAPTARLGALSTPTG